MPEDPRTDREIIEGVLERRGMEIGGWTGDTAFLGTWRSAERGTGKLVAMALGGSVHFYLHAETGTYEIPHPAELERVDG